MRWADVLRWGNAVQGPAVCIGVMLMLLSPALVMIGIAIKFYKKQKRLK